MLRAQIPTWLNVTPYVSGVGYVISCPDLNYKYINICTVQGNKLKSTPCDSPYADYEYLNRAVYISGAHYSNLPIPSGGMAQYVNFALFRSPTAQITQ